ncbi:MAG: transcriptional regulator AraC family [Ilumatobacteraceae bacterium]|nr:transcriptional regulator AraC family [Ilumatobacteraceae bacterium]
MDILAAFLEGPRARGAFLLRSILSPPWSLRIQDEAPLTIVAMVQGQAWIVHDDTEPLSLQPGDVAIIRGPAPYTVADQPDTAPSIIILPGQVCVTPDGVSLSDAMDLGMRTWGNSANGSVIMLTGTYTTDGEISQRLLDALPQLVVLRRDEWRSPVIDMLTDEITRDAPGQEVVLDRLLDLLLISALRAWFARPGADTPAWYRVHDDPVVGRALRMLHDDPARQWTVAELASDVGVSRAALARRFNDLVGEPPMHYLAGWRLALAADHLRKPGATVTAVARRVGYTSPFTFSAAFKRTYGVSPRDHRLAAAG